MKVKICGITKPSQGVAIAQLGADALGFVCVNNSPRYVSPSQIQDISQMLPAHAASGTSLKRVGVFVNEHLEQIKRVVDIGQLTSVQLHGDESPGFCQLLRRRLPQIEIIKALRIETAGTFLQMSAYQGIVDALLLDTYTPSASGGTGQIWDWSLLENIKPVCPWFLAGGLTPDNVVAALEQVSPPGIDLSSGVERAPGDKDLQKLEKLFQLIAQL